MIPEQTETESGKCRCCFSHRSSTWYLSWRSSEQVFRGAPIVEQSGRREAADHACRHEWQ